MQRDQENFKSLAHSLSCMSVVRLSERFRGTIRAASVELGPTVLPRAQTKAIYRLRNYYIVLNVQ